MREKEKGRTLKFDIHFRLEIEKLGKVVSWRSRLRTFILLPIMLGSCASPIAPKTHRHKQKLRVSWMSFTTAKGQGRTGAMRTVFLLVPDGTHSLPAPASGYYHCLVNDLLKNPTALSYLLVSLWLFYFPLPCIRTTMVVLGLQDNPGKKNLILKCLM